MGDTTGVTPHFRVSCPGKKSTRCPAAVGVHPAVRAVARLRGAEAHLGHEAGPGRLAGRQRAEPGDHRSKIGMGHGKKMGDFLRIFSEFNDLDVDLKADFSW